MNHTNKSECENDTDTSDSEGYDEKNIEKRQLDNIAEKGVKELSKFWYDILEDLQNFGSKDFDVPSEKEIFTKLIFLSKIMYEVTKKSPEQNEILSRIQQLEEKIVS